jgi:sugar O-acyltransferase (sialic acid O-acetyltransferase NeuD family)
MFMPRRVIIIGAGGHAQVIADIMLRSADAGMDSVPVGYLDDNANIIGHYRLGLPILGFIDHLQSVPHDAVIIGIGDNCIRHRMFNSLQRSGESIITVCHPSVVIAPDVSIGTGTVIAARTVINTGSIIGANVIINTGSIIDHHCHIGNHTHIAPGSVLGGGVTVGEQSLVGMGAILLPQCTVGNGCTIGAGACVHRAVSDGLTVIGVPARPLLHQA